MRSTHFQWRFWIWIVAGFFICLAIPTAVRTLSCKVTQSPVFALPSQAAAPQLDAAANSSQLQPPQIRARQSGPDRETEAPIWFCDTKITDWALIFFTYALVIVGWFTMRGNEQMTRDVERAHIFAGPQDYRLHEDNTVSFDIACENTGRSPGIVKRIYAEFYATEPTAELAYDIVDAIEDDFVLAPNVSSAIHNFRSSIKEPRFVAGFVDYEDIFRRRHRSKFCLQFINLPEHRGRLRVAGPREMSDWN